MALFLLATIAGRPVAIASDQVESVVDIDAIVPVPGTSQTVRGLAALRSRVVTVIDSMAVLGVGDDRKPGRAIVTKCDGHHYAIMVDALDDVVPFESQPLASGVALEGAWQRVASGMVERDGEPVLVIDIAGLIPGAMLAA